MSFGAAGSYEESRLGSFGTYHPMRPELQLRRNRDIGDGNTEQKPRFVPVFHTSHIRASSGSPQLSWKSIPLTVDHSSSSSQGVGLNST
ncbi:hypothetical protein ASPFODRAFT_54817 [Aspergillus luchuensis CBS 106.47]|uniref:Uncharacterized protein n=1 Tax=Aspergillus luchuensis (strain CBS 106.47) TaxID=1137211 RepID=A0A1M3SYY9_ASPLC|nr:hypothetical protein ASPFODRAFT_54817 [Aspergillus luchuensis CBS 106.47]